ncbi:MAG: Gfo/Idh/MocA family oxidoreductase [Clostridia bacterium]|nr:Gfo/Idh/MocA family oxidoreductase [Clostridia bacterium]
MIRYGIIGAGRIAKRFADSMKNLPDIELTAISGRNMERLKEFQKEHGGEKIYLSHDELINDPDVDFIYISLPNAFHKEYTIKALENHKPVICEKPAAVDPDELHEMIECARKNGVLFMEAMKSRFTPCYIEARSLLLNGRIGEIKRIDCKHGVIVPTDDPHRYDPRCGGILRDIGIYCGSWYAEFSSELPVIKTIDKEFFNGADKYVNTTFTMKDTNGNDILCSMEIAYDRKIPSEITFTGTKGTLTVRNLHRPDSYTITENDREAEFSCPYVFDDFYGEAEHFYVLLKCGFKESKIMSLDDSVRVSRFVDTFLKK